MISLLIIMIYSLMRKNRNVSIVPNSKRFLNEIVSSCVLTNKKLNVSKYSHLGHIITNNFDDRDDISGRLC